MRRAEKGKAKEGKKMHHRHIRLPCTSDRYDSPMQLGPTRRRYRSESNRSGYLTEHRFTQAGDPRFPQLPRIRPRFSTTQADLISSKVRSGASVVSGVWKRGTGSTAASVGAGDGAQAKIQMFNHQCWAVLHSYWCWTLFGALAI